MQEESSAAELISSAIEMHITEEFSRKSSLEQRAVTAITVAGALITALGGFTAIAHKGDLAFTAGFPAWCLAAAVILFSLGAFVAILAVAPFRYASVDPADLATLLAPSIFYGSRARVDRRLAEVRLGELASFRKGNAFKGIMVVTAFSFVTAALVSLTIAVAVVITRGS